MGVNPRQISSRRNERGQITVLFALVFTFMFILFAFVIDFGHLINNKINLQIAADMAAYSGAAWQARILDTMGMVNYRLRQNLKEMTVRANVTHLRHNLNFPRANSVGQILAMGEAYPTSTELFVCQQAHGYRSLSGVAYDVDTNLCKNASPSTGGLPPIVVPPVIAAFDPLVIAVRRQIERIQQASNLECRAAANDNEALTDYMIAAYTNRSRFYEQQMRALEAFLNGLAAQNNAEASTHPIARIAYQTFRRNLTISNADPAAQPRLEIIRPQGDRFIQLSRPFKLRGTLFYMKFAVQGNGCVGLPGWRTFTDMTVGFAKEEEILTYFAVKATAKPRLFFMPQKWIDAAFPELVAVSAAKPFGSRIGPKITADIFAPIQDRPGNANQIMNYAIRPTGGNGMLNTKLMAFYDALHPFNSISRPQGNRQLAWFTPRYQGGSPNPAPEVLRAVQAPTLFDAAFFTIYPDVGGNANTDYLEPQFAAALYPDYMQSYDANGNLISLPPPRTPAYLNGAGIVNGFVRQHSPGLGGGGPYGDYLAEGPGTHSVTSAIGIGGIINSEAIANEFGFASPRQIHSAWSPDPIRKPRIGYSVKFVGMDALTRSIRVTTSTGAEGPIANPPVGDPDFLEIFH